MGVPADPPPPDSACWAKAKTIFLENILSTKKRPSQESIDRFLKEDFRLDKAISKCETLKTAAENQYNKGKGSRFVGKLLEVLVMVKEVADPFLEFAPESVSIAWSAVSFLIQVGASDLENCGLIAEACTSIATVILNCRLYENRYSQSNRFEAGDKDTELEIMNAIPNLLSLVLEFSWYIQTRLSEHKILRSFKETFNPKLKDKYEELQEEYKKLRQIAGDAFQERVMDMMDQLSKHSEGLRTTLFPALEDIRSKLEEISEIKQILSESQIRDQFLRNRASLAPNSIHETQLNIVLTPLSHETENLCQWLFEDDYYLQWEANAGPKSGTGAPGAAAASENIVPSTFGSLQKLEKNEAPRPINEIENLENEENNDSAQNDEKPPRICYIKGRPGFGKSVTVACALTRLAKPEKKSSVCYFFFRKGDESTQTSRVALLSLTTQIFSEKFATTKSEMEKFSTLVENAWHTADEKLTDGIVNEGINAAPGQLSMLSNNILKKLVEDLSKTHRKPIYVVLDAIDECVDYESEELVPWLLELARSPESNIKVLFSSRDSLGLESLLAGENWDAGDDNEDTASEGGDVSEKNSSTTSQSSSATSQSDDGDSGGSFVDDDGEEDEDNEEGENGEEDAENEGEEGKSIAKKFGDSIILTVTETTNSSDMDSYLRSSLTKLVTRRMVNYRFGHGKTIDVTRMIEGIKKKANGMFTYSAMVIASLGQPSSLSLAERLKRLPDGMDELYRRRLESLTTEERKLVTLALKRIVFGLGDIGTVEIAEQFKQFYENEESDEDESSESHFDLISHAATSTVGDGGEGEGEAGDEGEEIEQEETGHLKVTAGEDDTVISVIDETEDEEDDDVPIWQKSHDDALNNPEVADTIYHLEQAGRDFFQFSSEKKTIDVIHKSVRDWVENEASKAAERDNNKVSLNSLFTWDDKTQSLRLSMPIPTNLMQANPFVDFQSERDTHLDIAIYNLKALNNKKFQEQYMPEPQEYAEEGDDEDGEDTSDEEEDEDEGGGSGGEEEDGEAMEKEDSQGEKLEASEKGGKANAKTDNGAGAIDSDAKPSTENTDVTAVNLDTGSSTESKEESDETYEPKAEDEDSDENSDEESVTGTDSTVEPKADDRKALGYVIKNTHRYEVVRWGEHLKKVEELFPPEERVGQKWEVLWEEIRKFLDPDTFNRWAPHWFQFALGESIKKSFSQDLLPLQLTAWWGLSMVMEHLLDVMGVDPSQADSGGDTPLHAAFLQANLVELLLKHNADVNRRTSDGRTCFQLVCSSSEFSYDDIDLESHTVKSAIKVLKMLMEAGSDVNDKTAMPKERPPFFSALAAGDLDLFNHFMKHGVDVQAADLNGFTPLHKVWATNSTATKEDRAEMAEELIKAGANVNAEDIDSTMPLSLAVLFQNRRGVELLIQHGADVMDEDTRGYQAIHDAAAPLEYEDDKTALAILGMLFDKGANVKCIAKSGKTPILLALLDQHKTVFEHLIQRLIEQESSGTEVLVNSQFEGENLFHSASRVGSSQIGVESAMALAKYLSKEQILEMLGLREPEKSKPPLLLAAFFERLDLVKYYLELGADISVEDVDNLNVLRFIFDDWLLKSLLITPPKDILTRAEMMVGWIKSNPELIKSDGDEFLRGAVSRRAVPLVTALVDAGVSPLTNDATGWNCLDLAIGTGFTAKEYPSIQSAISEYRKSIYESKTFTSPTRMSSTKKSKYIEVSEDGLTITEPDLPDEFSDIDKEIVAATVFADAPIPPKVDVFYYEVTLRISDPGSPYVAIGLVADPCPTDRMPGLAYSNTTSYAWHGDDGRLYTSRAPGSWYYFNNQTAFKTGDVIGCGYNKVLKEVFYTRNGEYIGVGWGLENITGERLWPAVGSKAMFSATINFGATPYMWPGLEELMARTEETRVENLKE
ncbi:hypothetical protein TWF970_004570 [Orbilia oligospora]|uniref:B30.2/SPRY domain-containing protein n=1 Tax=Orbilia oligospora TaxID=2813651 RepID=A0A7C8VEF3_ORBOL|nr:hypothetical protein TWF970_004570 [Orbilia oligospora]